MTEPKEAEDLLERAKRWAMNTGWDGNPNSVPMRLIAENAALREKLAIALEALGRINHGEWAYGMRPASPHYIARKALEKIDTLTGGDNAQG